MQTDEIIVDMLLTLQKIYTKRFCKVKVIKEIGIACSESRYCVAGMADYSAVRIPSIRTMIPAIHCSSSAF